MRSDEAQPAPTETPAPAPLQWVGVVGLAGVLGAFLFESWSASPDVDDAYISYRYARNLVNGHGLVFNPGEYVEGYTNFLWTLGIAAGLALGLTAEGTSHALSVFSGCAVLIGTWGYARRTLPPRGTWLAFVPAALVLASTAFSFWVTSGLETGLFVAAVTAALWAEAARRIGWATAAASVAALTRPDGVLIAGVIYVFHLWRHRAQPLTALRAPAVFATLILGQSLFRWLYYDSIVPNTFYAKVPGVPWYIGADYLERFLHAGSAALLIPAAWAAWRVPSLRTGALAVATIGFYAVAVGGDYFGHGRFLLPALPALAVLATAGVENWTRANRLLGAIGVAFLAAALWVPIFGIDSKIPNRGVKSRSEALADRHVFDRATQSIEWERTRVLQRRAGSVKLIGATGIGYLGYRTDIPILDILGIVDSTIARQEANTGPRGMTVPGHSRSNADYVLSRRPDYLIIPRKGTMSMLSAHLDLWEHPDFDDLYVWDEPFLGYRLRSLPSPPP